MKKAENLMAVTHTHTHGYLNNNVGAGLVSAREKDKYIKRADARPAPTGVKFNNIIFRQNTAITLIALVITIIVLLILAGVALNMIMGENGIFSKANISKEKTNYTSAKELLDVKLLDIQAECAKEGKAYNVKEITDNIELSSEEQIILEKYYYGSTSKRKDGITRDTTKSVIGIVVSVREYSQYKFLIGEEGKITGVTTADIDSMSITDFDTIEEFEQSQNISTNTDALSNGEENEVNAYLDFENATAYNNGGFVNNSTANIGQYKITENNGYEKLNIPIVGCNPGSAYKISFNMQVKNANFYNSYSYTYRVSDSVGMSNDNIDYGNELIRDSNSNEYIIGFIATETTMFINFNLADFYRDGIYDIEISLNSIDTKLKKGNLDFNQATAYNNGGFINSSTANIGQYEITTNNGYEKLNIPIQNCEAGEMYIVSFQFQVKDAEFINSYKFNYGVSDSEGTSNSDVNYGNDLIKDSNLNSYKFIFKATNSVMYLNFNLVDLKDSKTYTIMIDNN